jgi:natural product precursor
VRKKTIKKLTLNKESIRRLDPSNLREVVGGVSKMCTNTAECTESCQLSCACATRLC